MSNVTAFGRMGFCNCMSLATIHLSGCSSFIAHTVQRCGLQEFVSQVEARPKRSREESPHESQKRLKYSE